MSVRRVVSSSSSSSFSVSLPASPADVADPLLIDVGLRQRLSLGELTKGSADRCLKNEGSVTTMDPEGGAKDGLGWSKSNIQQGTKKLCITYDDRIYITI